MTFWLIFWWPNRRYWSVFVFGDEWLKMGPMFPSPSFEIFGQASWLQFRKGKKGEIAISGQNTLKSPSFRHFSNVLRLLALFFLSQTRCHKCRVTSIKVWNWAIKRCCAEITWYVTKYCFLLLPKYNSHVTTSPVRVSFPNVS